MGLFVTILLVTAFALMTLPIFFEGKKRMNWVQYLSMLKKIKKLFKSSGKGVYGLSKTFIGILIIVLPVFGLEDAARIIQGQEVELSLAVRNIITGIGVVVTVWGTVSKQDVIEKGEE